MEWSTGGSFVEVVIFEVVELVIFEVVELSA